MNKENVNLIGIEPNTSGTQQPVLTLLGLIELSNSSKTSNDAVNP